MGKVYLALVIHAHQPVGNFDHVVEEAYQKSYSMFVRTLKAHPKIRLALHFSGSLLERLEQTHPEFFDELRGLLARGQIELFGGGFYEPILPAIEDGDKIAQIRRLADYLESRFKARPRGAWIAERVWEPTLARPLAQAGVEYSILDDTHFLAAGLEPSQLRGDYITESLGASLRLVPSLQALRYTIPFRDPAETISILREARGSEETLFASGDDCEKFGIWPGTYEHCYVNGWLERFLQAVEAESEWIETIRLSDYLGRRKPLGRVYLPTASYSEMMEWALPVPAARQFQRCAAEVASLGGAERFRAFLRGGVWQNFLSKYSESNQMQKLALDVNHRLRRAALARRESAKAKAAPSQFLVRAHTHLLAAQCNDSYWHGIFGGLYAPHLRSAVLRHLIQAESLLDQWESESGTLPKRAELRDFDADGRAELIGQDSAFGMVIKPRDGGTASSLRFKPAGVELVNSLMRRPEVYHDAIRHHMETGQTPGGQPASIHDRMWSKEANLEALLRYDRYARTCFRSYLFPAAKQWQDFEQLRLDEHHDLAGGEWETAPPGETSGEISMRRSVALRIGPAEVPLDAIKSLSSRQEKGVWILECATKLSCAAPINSNFAYGLEMVCNLLAPNAPDRYFEASGVRHPLEFKGELPGPEISLVDEWQRVRITLQGGSRVRWWIVPIETISQSEAGYERVYQGSAILAVWTLPDSPSSEAEFELRVEVATFEPA